MSSRKLSPFDAFLPVVAFCFYLATLVVFLEALSRNHLLSVSMSLDTSSDSYLVHSSNSTTNATTNMTTATSVLLNSEVQYVALGSVVAISSLLVMGLLVSIANFIDIWPLLCDDDDDNQTNETPAAAAASAVVTRRSYWKGKSKSAQILSNILLSGGCACLMLLSICTMISWATAANDQSNGRGFSSSAVTQSVVAFWVLVLLLCPIQLLVHYRVAPATRKTTRLRLLLSSPQRLRRRYPVVGPRIVDEHGNVSSVDADGSSSNSGYANQYRAAEHEEEVDEETAEEEKSTAQAMMLLFTGGTEYEQRIFAMTKWLSFTVGMLAAVFNFIAFCTLAAAFDQDLFQTQLADGTVVGTSSSVVVKRLTAGLVAQLCIVCFLGFVVGLVNGLEWVLLDTDSDALAENEALNNNINNSNDNADSSDDENYDSDGRRNYYLCGWLRRPFSCYIHIVLPAVCINSPTRKRVQIFANRFLAGAHSISACMVAVTLVTSLIAKSRRKSGFENPDVAVAFWVFLGLASAAQVWSWALVPTFLLSRLLVELKNHEDERAEEREQAERHRLLRDAAAAAADHPQQQQQEQFDPRDANHLLHDVQPGKQFLDPWRPRNHVVPRVVVQEEEDYDDENDEDEERLKSRRKHEMRPEDLEEMEQRRLRRVRFTVARSLSLLRQIDPEQARHWALLSQRAQRWRDSAGYLFWQRFEKVLAHAAARNRGIRSLKRRNMNPKQQQQQPVPRVNATEPIASSAGAAPAAAASSPTSPSSPTSAAADEKKKKESANKRRKRRSARAKALALAKLLGNFHAFRVMSSAPTTAHHDGDEDEEDDDEDEEKKDNNNNNNNNNNSHHNNPNQHQNQDDQEDEDEQRALAFPPCKRLVSTMSLLAANPDTAPLLFSRFVADDDINTVEHLRAGLYSVQLCVGGVWRRVHLDSLVPVQPPEHVAELGVDLSAEEEEAKKKSSSNKNDDDDEHQQSCFDSICGGASSTNSNASGDSSALRRLLSPHCARELPEIYPALVHKAAAKLLGSFAAVATELGDALDEIHDVAGVPIERFSTWHDNTTSSSSSPTSSSAATTSAFVEMEEVLMRFDGRIEDMCFYPVVVLTSRRFAVALSQKQQKQQQRKFSIHDRSIESLVAPLSRGGRGVCGGVPCRVMAAVSCPRDAVKAAQLVEEIKRYKRRINLAAWSRSRDGLDHDDDYGGDMLDFSSDDDHKQQKQQQPPRPDSPVLVMPLDDDELEIKMSDSNQDDGEAAASAGAAEQPQQQDDNDDAGEPEQEEAAPAAAAEEEEEEEPFRFVLCDDDSLLNDAESEFAALRRVLDRRLLPDSHLRRLIASAARCHDRHGLFSTKDENNNNSGDDDDEEEEYVDESGIDPFSTIVPLTRPLPIVGFGRFNRIVSDDGEDELGAASSSSSSSAAFLCRDAIATHLMRSGLCVADDLSVCTFADARIIARLFFVEWSEATASVFCRAGCAHVPVTGFLDDIADVHVSLGEENGMAQHAAREAVRFHRMRFMYQRYAEERRKRRHKRKQQRKMSNNNNNNLNSSNSVVAEEGSVLSFGEGGGIGRSGRSSPTRNTNNNSRSGTALSSSGAAATRSSRSPSPTNPFDSSASPVGAPTAAAAAASEAGSFRFFSSADFGSFSEMSLSMSPSMLFNKVATASALFFEQNPHLQRKWIDQEVATFVGIASRTPSFAMKSLPLISPMTDLRLPNRFRDFGASSDWVLKVNVVCAPAPSSEHLLLHGGSGSEETGAQRRSRTTTTVFVGLHQPDARNAVAALLTEGERRGQPADESTLPACGCTYHPCMVSVLRVPKPSDSRQEQQQQQQQQQQEEDEQKRRSTSNSRSPPRSDKSGGSTSAAAAAATAEVPASLVITAHKQSNSNSFASDRDVYLRVELEGAPAADGGETYLIVPRMQVLHQHLFYLSEQEEQHMEAMRVKREKRQQYEAHLALQRQMKQKQQNMMQQQQQQQQRPQSPGRQRPQSSPPRQGGRASSPSRTAAAPASASASASSNVFDSAFPKHDDDRDKQKQQQQQEKMSTEAKTHTVRNRDGSTYTISLEPQVSTIKSPSSNTVVERKCYQVWQTVPSKKKNKSNNSNSISSSSSLIPRRQVLLNTKTESASFVLSLLLPKSVPFQLSGIRAGDDGHDQEDEDDDDDQKNKKQTIAITASLIRPSQRLAAEVAEQCESPLEQLASRLKHMPKPEVLAEMVAEAKLSVLSVSRAAVLETVYPSSSPSPSAARVPFSMEEYLTADRRNVAAAAAARHANSRNTNNNNSNTQRQQQRQQYVQQEEHFFVRELLADVPASISGGRVPLAQLDSEALF